jgi:hypothetical protein
VQVSESSWIKRSDFRDQKHANGRRTDDYWRQFETLPGDWQSLALTLQLLCSW